MQFSVYPFVAYCSCCIHLVVCSKSDIVCRLFISCEIHCYMCPHIFWVYHFSLSQCDCALFLFSDTGISLQIQMYQLYSEFFVFVFSALFSFLLPINFGRKAASTMIGSFQLEFVSISRVINHMTC